MRTVIDHDFNPMPCGPDSGAKKQPPNPGSKKFVPKSQKGKKKKPVKSYAQIEKELNGLKFDANTIHRRQRTIIESNAWRRRNLTN